MTAGSAMNRFRKSLTNRRSLRAKYAAHVIDTNNKELQVLLIKDDFKWKGVITIEIIAEINVYLGNK